MRKFRQGERAIGFMNILGVVFILALGGVASVALADGGGHATCKTKPHLCDAAATTRYAPGTQYSTTTVQGETQTVTVEQPTTVTNTVTVAGSATSSAAATGGTINVTIKPGTVVITKTVTHVRILRRWCTHQRHGWRCIQFKP